jgi:hypothetical protein
MATKMSHSIVLISLVAMLLATVEGRAQNGESMRSSAWSVHLLVTPAGAMASCCCASGLAGYLQHMMLAGCL